MLGEFLSLDGFHPMLSRDSTQRSLNYPIINDRLTEMDGDPPDHFEKGSYLRRAWGSGCNRSLAVWPAPCLDDSLTNIQSHCYRFWPWRIADGCFTGH